VYQSLLRTFSHTPVVEVEEEGETTADSNVLERKITYRDFMETWAGLLEAPNVKVGETQITSVITTVLLFY